MKPSAILLRRVSLVITVCLTLFLYAHAQQPVTVEKPATQTITGTVTQFTHAPTGEVDGFELDGGTTVHYPRSLARQVTAVIARDTHVRVTGLVASELRRVDLIEAETIINLTTSQTLELEKLLLQGPSPAASQPGQTTLTQ